MNTYTNDKFTLVLFVVYTIFYEFLIWGITISLIYFLNWSALISIITILAQADMEELSEFKRFIQYEKEYNEN